MHGLIRRAVESYDLPDKIRQRVLERAERDITRLGLTGFDSQYKYVAELAERFQYGYEERFNVSLDSRSGEDSRRSLHEVLEDKTVPDLRLNDLDYKPTMSLYKVVSLLQSFLPNEQKELVLRLMNESRNSEMDLQLEEILSESLLIRERVQKLVGLLGEDSRFRQPERKLIYVNLDSPYVRFGKRDYHGNPLDYFRRHQDVYGRFVIEGRFALAEFDSGLYASLKRRQIQLSDGSTIRQIDLVIPNKITSRYDPYGGNPLKYLWENYRIYMGINKKALKKFDSGLYRKLVSTNNLEEAMRLLQGNPNCSDRYQILEAHSVCNCNSNLAANMIGVGADVVLRVWHRYGLNVGRPINRRSREDELVICDSHRLYDGNCLLAARHFGLSTSTVWVVWRKYGLQTKFKRGGKLRKQKVA